METPGAEILRLREEVAQLQAKQAAWIIALEELSRWPDMPGVEFWTCPTNLPGPLPGNKEIKPGKFILHPERIKGIFRAIEKHAKENFPSAKEAVREWQDGFYKDSAIRLEKEKTDGVARGIKADQRALNRAIEEAGDHE